MKFGLRYASLGRYSNGPAAVELAQAAEAAGFDSIWTVDQSAPPPDCQHRSRRPTKCFATAKR